MKKCIRCEVELTEENSYSYDIQHYKYMCKKCKIIDVKKYKKPYIELSEEQKKKINNTHYNYNKRTNYKYIKEYNKKQTELFNKEVSKEDRQFIKEETINKIWNKIKSKGL